MSLLLLFFSPAHTRELIKKSSLVTHFRHIERHDFSFIQQLLQNNMRIMLFRYHLAVVTQLLKSAVDAS